MKGLRASSWTETVTRHLSFPERTLARQLTDFPHFGYSEGWHVPTDHSLGGGTPFISTCLPTGPLPVLHPFWCGYFYILLPPTKLPPFSSCLLEETVPNQIHLEERTFAFIAFKVAERPMGTSPF
ncbi:hypothetical protein AVEN_55691-1 [Araneus ventricosus]|uniref:Uncharacterized protein n=1 Tax=Araneus ventricosus TaxID=182803 RepID=A0A4Y2IXQ6_ARAVE|nr:hypothetical protein AVEN_55691-1 [Araneus ventricosus]